MEDEVTEAIEDRLPLVDLHAADHVRTGGDEGAREGLQERVVDLQLLARLVGVEGGEHHPRVVARHLDRRGDPVHVGLARLAAHVDLVAGGDHGFIEVPGPFGELRLHLLVRVAELVPTAELVHLLVEILQQLELLRRDLQSLFEGDRIEPRPPERVRVVRARREIGIESRAAVDLADPAGG